MTFALFATKKKKGKMMIFKESTLTIRLSKDVKDKVLSYAKKNKTTVTRIIEAEFQRIIKKDQKNESN